MKRVVYSDILDIDKICSVYHKIMYNTKHRNKIFDYNMFYTSNIISMKNGITFLYYKYIFRNNKLYMLVPSFNKRRIKRRIGKGITNINNYNGYLKYADASYFFYKYGCKK